MRKSVILIFLTTILFGSNAQTPEYITFQEGWYVGINTGATWFFGEGTIPIQKNNNFALTKNCGNSFRLLAGYDFNPVIGVRGTAGYGRYYWPLLKNPEQKLSLNATQFTIDLTVDLTNWWCDFDPDRKINFLAFGGTGINQRAKGDLTSTLTSGIIGGGVEADWHLSPQLTLNLSMAADGVSDSFNGLASGFPLDICTDLSIGFVYHFRYVNGVIYRW